MKQLAFLLIAPALVAAGTPTIVSWSATVPLVSRRAPSEAMIRVKGYIVAGWHVYSVSQKPGGPKPLSFELADDTGFSLGPAKGPKPQSGYDAEFRMATETYSGAPAFTIPVRWTRPLNSRSTQLKLVVRYQACSDKLCLPPKKEVLAVELRSPGAR